MVTAVSPANDMRALWQISCLIRKENPDIIHLHSSKAGVLGRIAAAIFCKQQKVFYSPHGFSFLREDVSPLTRKLFLIFEKYAGILGGVLLASSKTEFELAHAHLSLKRIELVENCVAIEEVPVTISSKKDRLRVITTARISYQKAPWRFRNLAIACDDIRADFVWLGDGALRDELLKDDGTLPNNLDVLGTQTRSEAYGQLINADIFVLPSLWEGMPLALIEAQVSGLPAIVSNVVGNRDVVIDGVTGFVCDSDQTLIEKTRLLIQNAELRKEMGANARAMSLERFAVSRMYKQVNHFYTQSHVAARDKC